MARVVARSKCSVAMKCCKRSCPIRDPNIPKLTCSKDGCNQKIHLACYQQFVLKPMQEKNLADLKETYLLEMGHIAC